MGGLQTPAVLVVAVDMLQRQAPRVQQDKEMPVVQDQQIEQVAVVADIAPLAGMLVLNFQEMAGTVVTFLTLQ
jgi:hypothetical protein